MGRIWVGYDNETGFSTEVAWDKAKILSGCDQEAGLGRVTRLRRFRYQGVVGLAGLGRFIAQVSYPGSKKQNRSLHTCAQDVQITRTITI
jgi:hypothetical protein